MTTEHVPIVPFLARIEAEPVILVFGVIAVAVLIWWGARKNGEPDSDAPTTADDAPQSGADFVGLLAQRYSDAYTEAHAVVAVGKTIKTVAGFLFAGILCVGFMLGAESSSGGNSLFAVAGFVMACAIGIPVYVLGVLVSAQGQTALATLDTAVNSSRHLSDPDVARILSKRFTV